MSMKGFTLCVTATTCSQEWLVQYDLATALVTHYLGNLRLVNSQLGHNCISTLSAMTKKLRRDIMSYNRSFYVFTTYPNSAQLRKHADDTRLKSAKIGCLPCI